MIACVVFGGMPGRVHIGMAMGFFVVERCVSDRKGGGEEEISVMVLVALSDRQKSPEAGQLTERERWRVTQVVTEAFLGHLLTDTGVIVVGLHVGPVQGQRLVRVVAVLVDPEATRDDLGFGNHHTAVCVEVVKIGTREIELEPRKSEGARMES